MHIKTLKHKKDIAVLFSTDDVSVKSYSNRNLCLRTRVNNLNCIRVLFAMSRKKASKPIRNKQIRRIRFIVKNAAYSNALSCDVAIIIKNPMASFENLKTSYLSLIYENIN